MEEGSFRCDANVSVMPEGAKEFGTRTELKNMNSFRHVERALEYEIYRQTEVLKEGGKVIQETRLWNEPKNITESMRGKEEAHDYRYFPDPDLVLLKVDKKWIEKIREDLPELPDEKVGRFKRDYGLPGYDASVLTTEVETADYFEAVVSAGAAPKPASNWIMVELMRELKENKIDIEDSPISPKAMAELIGLIEDGTISGKIAKTVFSEMYKTKKGAGDIVEKEGLEQITDTGEIEKAIEKVITDNPVEAKDYRAGKDKLLKFFVGQVMKETKGKANPQMVNDILVKKLKE
jgi:aspartyl-tRNA(Asn)/glutamyl-tRNA(Gln) amidotransferase subunit B